MQESLHSNTFDIEARLTESNNCKTSRLVLNGADQAIALTKSQQSGLDLFRPKATNISKSSPISSLVLEFAGQFEAEATRPDDEVDKILSTIMRIKPSAISDAEPERRVPALVDTPPRTYKRSAHADPCRRRRVLIQGSQ